MENKNAIFNVHRPQYYYYRWRSCRQSAAALRSLLLGIARLSSKFTDLFIYLLTYLVTLWHIILYTRNTGRLMSIVGKYCIAGCRSAYLMLLQLRLLPTNVWRHLYVDDDVVGIFFYRRRWRAPVLSRPAVTSRRKYQSRRRPIYHRRHCLTFSARRMAYYRSIISQPAVMTSYR